MDRIGPLLGSADNGNVKRIVTAACSVSATGLLLYKGYKMLPDSDDQNVFSMFKLLTKYWRFDFTDFLRSHKAALEKGQQTGDYVAGVCNYYKLMGDVITIASGPFWHFVPMTQGLSRKQCHHKFHSTVAKFLRAQPEDNILEYGCGFGEVGRQVAMISGATVSGLTMADEEIVGGTERNEKAGLGDKHKMVQGNYHSMPFTDGQFDKVFGIYTLKYSADVKQAMKEFSRVMKSRGRLVSYEILTTDKYDPSNATHKYYVDNISISTCMPPLWKAQAVRDAAKEAGLVAVEEFDLCAPATEDAWYSCFETTKIHSLLSSSLIYRLVRFGEGLRMLPRGFAEFYDYCLVHPTTDFVNAGRLGLISGAIMMVWEKP